MIPIGDAGTARPDSTTIALPRRRLAQPPQVIVSVGHQEESDMATILLVHGAWHGSWCWAKVVSLLQRDGLNAVTLDLPGRAGDAMPIEHLTLERYARTVCH